MTNKLFVRHYDNTVHWTVQFSSDSGGTTKCPSVADINNDGKIEIVAVDRIGVYVYNEDGNPVPGWPQNTTGGPYSITSPVVGDLNGDGLMEVIVNKGDGQVFVWYHNGTLFPNFPLNLSTEGGILAAPSLGDVNRDSSLDIAVGVSGPAFNGSVYVIESDGTIMSGWPQLGEGTTPAIGDIDGDLDFEVIDGIYAYHHDGAQVDGFPKQLSNWLGSAMMSSSALGDIDNDGLMELVIGPTDYGFDMYVYDLDGAYNKESIEWGMGRYDEKHSGAYLPEAREKSMINNTGTEDITGYLLMKVQKYSGSSWLDVHTVVDENSSRTVVGGNKLALDIIWAANGAYTTTEAGTFRAYAVFRNESGGAIQTETGLLEDNYNFTVS
jgi:hypothetical protein